MADFDDGGFESMVDSGILFEELGDFAIPVHDELLGVSTSHYDDMFIDEPPLETWGVPSGSELLATRFDPTPKIPELNDMTRDLMVPSAYSLPTLLGFLAEVDQVLSTAIPASSDNLENPPESAAMPITALDDTEVEQLHSWDPPSTIWESQRPTNPHREKDHETKKEMKDFQFVFPLNPNEQPTSEDLKPRRYGYPKVNILIRTEGAGCLKRLRRGITSLGGTVERFVGNVDDEEERYRESIEIWLMTAVCLR
jgi:hypothetical protein